MRLVLHELSLVLAGLIRNPPVEPLQLFPLELGRVVCLQLFLPWSYLQLPVPLTQLGLLVLVDVVLADPPRPEALPVPLQALVTRHDDP